MFANDALRHCKKTLFVSLSVMYDALLLRLVRGWRPSGWIDTDTRIEFVNAAKRAIGWRT